MTDLYPLRLPPSFRERIWGSQDLAPIFGKQDRKIGEAWFSFDENAVANGPLAGKSLRELMALYGPALMGTAQEGTSFPILAKLLFTTDRLSVQVHPNDEYALAHEGSPGKTEMWYVVAAEPGASVALGLTQTLTKEDLREAAVSGEIEHYLNWVQVEVGQTILVPAGMLHAIGPGLVLCEIQQNSDATYRFYDFGRVGADGEPRELHIEKALAVTEQKAHPGPTGPVRLPANGWSREFLVTCSYFAVERWSWEESIRHPDRPDQADLLIFLRGQGTVAGQPYAPGDAYLLPAILSDIELASDSPSEAIRAHLPKRAD